jgi:hypothetical protein
MQMGPIFSLTRPDPPVREFWDLVRGGGICRASVDYLGPHVIAGHVFRCLLDLASPLPPLSLSRLYSVSWSCYKVRARAHGGSHSRNLRKQREASGAAEHLEIEAQKPRKCPRRGPPRVSWRWPSSWWASRCPPPPRTRSRLPRRPPATVTPFFPSPASI